jgi:cold shock protein
MRVIQPAERCSQMATGKIKTLVKDRGFGFIAQDGTNSDVFFHSSSIPDGGFDALETNQTLEFDVEPDPRDPRRQRAINVRGTG